MEKNLPAMPEDLGSIPGSGRPLGKGMATHSSRLHSTRSQRVGQLSTTFTLSLFFHIYLLKYLFIDLAIQVQIFSPKRVIP